MAVQSTAPIEAIYFRDWHNTHIPEILEEIYLKDIYKPFLLGKRDLTIVDIGANIGLFSYYAKEYAKQIYALEPAKAHQEVITQMIAFNKIKNITLCPFAISNKTETLTFYHNVNTTAHSLSDAFKNPDSEQVEALSFDAFMEKYKIDHIDLLKLDPEGEEGKIITSSGFAKYAEKVKVVVGEWHAWGNMEQQQFATVFRDLGYQFNWIPNMKAAVYTAVRI